MVEDRPSGSPPSRAVRGRGWALGVIVGLGLVGLWLGLFVQSVRQDRLVLGGSTWVPILPCMGADFKLAIDHVARIQAMGFKPYQLPGDKHASQYPYPPMIGRYFRWVTFCDKMTASVLWQGSLVLFAVVGCIAAWRTREKLGLDEIPLTLMVAVLLFSTPFLYAVERGQCDPMIIPALLVAAWLLGRRGAWADLGAGGLLGLTAWIKYYPGLAVIALFTLDRKKALVSFLGVVALVGIVDLEGIRESIKAGKIIENRVLKRVGSVHVSSHSFIEDWKLNGMVRGSSLLSRVPTALPAALLLAPALVMVGRRMARMNDPQPLVFPYLLWLTSAATFALPYSNDYNLVTLPLAILAVWDRRDRLAVQVGLALLLPWWQPAWLPIDGGLLIFFKLGALYATGACLVARGSDLDGRQNEEVGRAMLYRPAFARILPRRDVPGSRWN